MPSGKTEVGLDTCGRLVTVLGVLASSFKTMAEIGPGISFTRSLGGIGWRAM